MMGWLSVLACTAEPPASSIDVEVDPPDVTVSTKEERDPRAAIEAALMEALEGAPAGVEGMALWVHDADDVRVIDVTVGAFDTRARRVVGTASRLVSALVILRAADGNGLRLSDPVVDLVSWDIDPAIELDMLPTMVSGLPGDGPCLEDPAASLAGCARELAEVDAVAEPGEAFLEGNAHFQMAGRLAEAASSGKPWVDLFEEGVKEPMGLDDSELSYFTIPETAVGQRNPSIGRGLRITMEEYAVLLGVVLREGDLVDGTRWLPQAQMSRLATNQYPHLRPEGYGLRFGYGFGGWLECAVSERPCPVLSSPGEFGFVPWVDRDKGYTAILAMEADEAGADGFAVALAQRLKPLLGSW